MKKQIQEKYEQHEQVETTRGRELKCDVCGIVLHQYAVSKDGKKIVSVLIEQDEIAHGIKFTVCRNCKDVIDGIPIGRRCTDMDMDMDMVDVEIMLRCLNAKLNKVIEALYSVSIDRE